MFGLFGTPEFGLDRFCQGTFDSPAKAESLLDDVFGNSKMLGPVRQNSCFTIVGQPNGSSGIVGLFLSSSPAAILWSVISFVVNAFDRMFLGRPGTHIFEKQRKGFPPITDDDSSTAVTLEVIRSWIAAPGFHVRPNAIFRYRRPCGCTESVSRDPPTMTSTRSGVSITQIDPTNDFFISTRTPAQPPGKTCGTTLIGKGDHGKSSEGFTNHVNQIAFSRSGCHFPFQTPTRLRTSCQQGTRWHQVSSSAVALAVPKPICVKCIEHVGLFRDHKSSEPKANKISGLFSHGKSSFGSHDIIHLSL